jgi:hypothetical protein
MASAGTIRGSLDFTGNHRLNRIGMASTLQGPSEEDWITGFTESEIGDPVG